MLTALTSLAKVPDIVSVLKSTVGLAGSDTSTMLLPCGAPQ